MRFFLFGLFPLLPFFWDAPPAPEKNKSVEPPAATTPAAKSPPASKC